MFSKIAFVTVVTIFSCVAAGQAMMKKKAAATKAEPEFCGFKEMQPDKTCISLRLPWQEEPIYFCTDKEDLKYRSVSKAHHCWHSRSQKTLLIATPWDSCPLSSTPDFCENRDCPEAPFNRTCTEIPTESKYKWDCCPTYYCDEVSAESCQMRQLEPECMSPPKDKTNCIGFKDPHGCCNKYQCEGDGKPGMCPMESHAKRLVKILKGGDKQKDIKKGMLRMGKLNSGSQLTSDIPCVGDYTCPGAMKCCSHSMSAYGGPTVSKIGLSARRNLHESSVYGYCIEPVME